MDQIKPTLSEYNHCIAQPHCIRNVCILAHVDHGKTTLADLLLATNKIVSHRSAGTVRYLDDRPDEQARGITMKSTGVSLLNILHDYDENETKKILLNMIDTPGHIDFSSEASAAIKVCEGALILVDAAEGVCVQTRESIKRAYEEQTKMILIINKIDRLILELGQDAAAMLQSILKIVEGCNVIVAEMYRSGFEDHTVDIEHSGLLFNPPTGNVIFASAADGWAFTTKQLCYLIANNVPGETADSLNSKMWDFQYYIAFDGALRTNVAKKDERNLFIQLGLSPIHHVYHTLLVLMRGDQVPNILDRLKIPFTQEILTATEPRVQLKAILSTWKPLAKTVMFQCLRVIPSPTHLTKAKVDYLLNSKYYVEDEVMNRYVEELAPHFGQVSLDSPVIVYVSKMLVMDSKNLPQNTVKPFLVEDKPLPDIALLHISDDSDDACASTSDSQRKKSKKEKTMQQVIAELSDDITLIGFCRVYSGSLHIGQEVYILPKDYNPSEKKQPKRIPITQLYMLFGKEFQPVECIPAGNFCGIGGLENDVTRTATISTSLAAIPLIERPLQQPVVRYTIEPREPRDLRILRNALKLVKVNDSCVEVLISKRGNITILTAGDVHMEKCLEDIKTRFGKVDVQVSRLMVPLRETIADDMSNGRFEYFTSCLKITLSCHPLNQDVAEFLTKHHSMLRFVEKHDTLSAIDILRRYDPANHGPPARKTFKNQKTTRAVALLEEELIKQLSSPAIGFLKGKHTVWSISENRECPNLLVNAVSDFTDDIFTKLDIHDRRTIFHHCIVNAFNALCNSGPICNEPLTQCCFFIHKLTFRTRWDGDSLLSELPDQESSLGKYFCSAFGQQELRIMEPVYKTVIEVNPIVLGLVHGVIHRRMGKVLNAVGMDPEETRYLVTAIIPVIESHGFATEIRTETSGQANPHLMFSHFEMLPGNPVIINSRFPNESEEDYELRVANITRAKRLVNDTRRRKGLKVQEQVVCRAEGQRNQRRN